MNVLSSSNIDRAGVYFAGGKFTELGYIYREQPIVDVGIDAQIELTNDNTGTGKLVGLQIKSGLSFFSDEKDEGFVFRSDQAHLDYWLNYSHPVLVVLYHPGFKELYWEVVSKEKITKTGKGWKLLIPKQQKVNIGMKMDIHNLVSKRPAFKNHTIVSTKYLSENGIKKYDISVVLNKEHTQSEIIGLCKSLLVTNVKLPLHSTNSPISYQFKDENLHMVSLLIYLSNDDEINENFISCARWISSNLTDEHSQFRSKGEDIGDEIIMVWNDDYHWLAQMNLENTANKPDYLSQTDALVFGINEKIIKTELLVKNFEDRNIDEPLLLITISEITESLDDDLDYCMGFDFAPFECKSLAKQFQLVVKRTHEFIQIFNNWASGKNQNFDLDYYYGLLEDYKKRVEGYNFERTKI